MADIQTGQAIRTMSLEIRGTEKYPMHIFWHNGGVWVDIIPAGYCGIAQWKKEMKRAGFCVGTIKRGKR